MNFQVSDLKRCYFLELCNRDNNPLELSYTKDSIWLKYFGYSNSLYTRAIRAIVNHTSIGKCKLRLFGLIYAQNSVSGLVLYNRLNFIKFSWLFGFNRVKICSHIHLFLLSNYLLQTLQIYLEFMQSFSLSKFKLLCNTSLLKHLLGDPF